MFAVRVIIQLYIGTRNWLSSSSNLGKLDLDGLVDRCVKNRGPRHTLVSIFSFGPFLIRVNVSRVSYSGDDTSDSVGDEAVDEQPFSGIETLNFFVSNMIGLTVYNTGTQWMPERS
jgi:hypothetical protein